MLPIPDAGIIPQSFPIVAAASFIDSDGDAVALADVAGAVLADAGLLDVADAAAAGLLVLLLAVLAQAAAVTAIATATSGIAVARRARELSHGRIASPGVTGTGGRVTVVTRHRGGPGLARQGKPDRPRRRITDVGMSNAGRRHAPAPATAAGAGRASAADLETLICSVARGDQGAFETLCARAGPAVFGVVRAVVRDPSQTEEVCQEVLLEVWCAASRFEPGRGSALSWLTTIAHRRAVDRVRSERRAAERQQRAASHEVAYDEVAETVEARLDGERVRRCLGSLTSLQRESVTLAYYGGYTMREVAVLLSAPEGTVKTRMRDGLIRLRDCLGGTR